MSVAFQVSDSVKVCRKTDSRDQTGAGSTGDQRTGTGQHGARGTEGGSCTTCAMRTLPTTPAARRRGRDTDETRGRTAVVRKGLAFSAKASAACSEASTAAVNAIGLSMLNLLLSRGLVCETKKNRHELLPPSLPLSTLGPGTRKPGPSVPGPYTTSTSVLIKQSNTAAVRPSPASGRGGPNENRDGSKVHPPKAKGRGGAPGPLSPGSES